MPAEIVLHDVINRTVNPISMGSYKCRILVVNLLIEDDIGKAVIYDDRHGKKEYGILTAWRGDFVFARYTMGDTSMGALWENMWFVVRKVGK